MTVATFGSRQPRGAGFWQVRRGHRREQLALKTVVENSGRTVITEPAGNVFFSLVLQEGDLGLDSPLLYSGADGTLVRDLLRIESNSYVETHLKGRFG